MADGLAVFGINPNDVDAYPEDAPDADACVRGRGTAWTFPYLYDESQRVAAAYGAACTPDFFLFDRDRALAYRQMDGSRPSNGVPVTGADLGAAVGAVLAGEPVTATSGRRVVRIREPGWSALTRRSGAEASTSTLRRDHATSATQPRRAWPPYVRRLRWESPPATRWCGPVALA